MQRVYNHAHSLRSCMGLPTDIASVPVESMAEENEDEDKDIVCDHPYLPTFKCCSELQLQGVPGFLDDPVLERGWEARHSCPRASPPMRCSVDGRHPPLRTCLSAHALEREWEARHPCQRTSRSMRWSVDGRHPPLLMCFWAHVLER